jgi:hypothetical protein
MRTNKIEITCPVAFAKICAQFVREGVTFEAHERANGEFLITLTGGY